MRGPGKHRSQSSQHSGNFKGKEGQRASRALAPVDFVSLAKWWSFLGRDLLSALSISDPVQRGCGLRRLTRQPCRGGRHREQGEKQAVAPGILAKSFSASFSRLGTGNVFAANGHLDAHNIHGPYKLIDLKISLLEIFRIYSCLGRARPNDLVDLMWPVRPPAGQKREWGKERRKIVCLALKPNDQKP